jgi:hypothetical protein
MLLIAQLLRFGNSAKTLSAVLLCPFHLILLNKVIKRALHYGIKERYAKSRAGYVQNFMSFRTCFNNCSVIPYVEPPKDKDSPDMSGKYDVLKGFPSID